MTTLSKEQQQVIDQAKDLLRPFVGQKVRMDVVRDAFVDLIKSAVPPMTDVTATSAWEAMTWRDKVKWWVSNKACPWIGDAMRQQHAEWTTLVHKLDEAAAIVPFELTLNRPNLPHWALRDPLQVVVVNARVVSQAPTDRITLNVKF